ncbi:hypothetical protein [Amycolatopsis magusensis]|uniref:hypothetical protein n=1 Tax=Amycolatopsis magusensis TaxID=882444 RepID=UPI00379C0FDB
MRQPAVELATDLVDLTGVSLAELWRSADAELTRSVERLAARIEQGPPQVLQNQQGQIC